MKHLANFDSIQEAINSQKELQTPFVGLIGAHISRVNGTSEGVPVGIYSEDGFLFNAIELADNQIKYFCREQITLDTDSAVTNYGVSITSQSWSNGLGIINFSGNVVKVSGDEFKGKEKLLSISLPRKVALLDDEVFKNCSNLKHISMTSNVSLEIGARVFQGCSRLMAIVFPETTTSIGANALDGMRRYISLPANLSTISDSEINGGILYYPGTSDEFTDIATTTSFTGGVIARCSDQDLVFGEVCLVEGTKILLANGNMKSVEDIVLGDEVVVYIDGELSTSKVGWVMTPIKVSEVAVITLEDNTTIEVNAPSGLSKCHRFLNATSKKYENAEDLVGKKVSTVNGDLVVKSIEIVNKTTSLYNLITENSMNYVANGLISATGFANSIQLTPQHTEEELARFEAKWVKLLNLKYSNEPLDAIEKYINKLNRIGK